MWHIYNSKKGGYKMKNYAAVLVKPDAIRDGLEGKILQDLQKEACVDPVFHKFWKVTKDVVKLIYPTWVERTEFPSMNYNLIQGRSIFVIVCGNHDIYTELTRVKGKMNKNGLRLKYRAHSIEEWQAMGYSGRALQHKIAENRLHTTDNFQETVDLCSLAVNQQDLASIEKTSPMLALAIQQKWASQL